MKKLISILFIFIVLFTFLFNKTVYATDDINMNLNNTENTTTSNKKNKTNNNIATVNNDDINEINSSNNSTSQVQVTTTQNQKSGLSFEGYASVILIATGIVLIFLAIAILIRCK